MNIGYEKKKIWEWEQDREEKAKKRADEIVSEKNFSGEKFLRNQFKMAYMIAMMEVKEVW